MDVVIRATERVLLALPPPPQPGVEETVGGERAWPVLLTAGLSLAAVALFTLGVVVGRMLAARGSRRSVAASLVRIERWRNGEAVVLGYAAGDAASVALRDHLAGSRAEREAGTVVLIEPLTDRIVALRAIDAGDAPLSAPAPARFAAPPRPRRRDAAVAVTPRA